MGYVRHEAGVDADFVAGGKWEIEVGLKRYTARASLKPMYDPTSARMKV
jgi:4-methylaminobutanoate oxidase (formaldehyde-forming)